MPRRGHRTPKAPLGNVSDPDCLYHHMRRFLAYMEVQHYSSATVGTWENHLRRFIQWCDERGLAKPQEIDRPTLELFQRHLFHYRKANGDPLSISNQQTRLIAVRQWFKWMTKQGHLPHNPASELELPKRVMRLPKAVLTAREAEAVLAVPDIRTTKGLRDRAILETFYSTGIRRAELINLSLQDVDLERGVVLIREGKGGKDRIIPIGDRALSWVAAYREHARPKLVKDGDDGTLFLTTRGHGLSEVRLSGLVRDCVTKAGIGKQGSCHLFRHAMATLMLENGADIRMIQEMLGHAQLSTTQIYTRVSIRALKAVHTATHPGRMPTTGNHALESDPESTAEG